MLYKKPLIAMSFLCAFSALVYVLANGIHLPNLYYTPDSTPALAWLDADTVIYGPGDPNDSCTVEFDGPIPPHAWETLEAIGIKEWQAACLEALKTRGQ